VPINVQILPSVMDYSCQDIPMRLDIKYQPLDFEVYLHQVIDIPRTSLEEAPYNFQLETQALDIVDKIIERNLKQDQEEKTRDPIGESLPEPTINASSEITGSRINSNSHETLSPTPSCPVEVPLTPIKSTINSFRPTEESQPPESPSINQINLRDFEDINYNPFDQLELQTIDELKELDLVFQASYANRAGHSQPQPNTNYNPSTQDSSTNTMAKSL